MNHPRYRVKTLLIATTVAAVVVACLAPWLRLVTSSQVATFFSRVLCVALGAIIALLITRSRYKNCYAEQCKAESVFHLQTIRVKPLTNLAWLAFIPNVGAALCLEFVLSPSVMSSFIKCFFWVISANYAVLLWPQLFTRPGEATLSETWFVHPYLTVPLSYYCRYRWKDRSAGTIDMRIGYFGTFELAVRREDIDVVDTLLSSKLGTPSG
ncbi:hypothetical protein NG895_14795 [Aeoliella sp. ICT_H6.2]|uniref:Uncharacterized protein n=1 Tax=Aeoliella straminimaris TaxID=2954799 RepID=A0A9X2JH76_9BACT|nr:hypothetical protein [Aeoliella straminimaris]MCO6045177.1 hypothetical protein [Aeoliella straminimaris]